MASHLASLWKWDFLNSEMAYSKSVKFLESGMLKESGIPLTNGILNQSSTDKESRI